MTPTPGFKVAVVEYLKNGVVRLTEKVTVEHQQETIPNISNGIMVPCLLTLTDLQMCRAGLSASAELLVLNQLSIYCNR